MCTCEEMERGRRGIHAHRASKLEPDERQWTQNCKLDITIQDPARVRKTDTFFLFTKNVSVFRTLAGCWIVIYMIYSYCILSRVKNLATSLLIVHDYAHLFLFPFNAARDVVMVLLIFVESNINQLIFITSHANTEAHTNKHTCMITTRHMSLVGRGGRKIFMKDKSLPHKKNCQKNRYLESKKDFEHIVLPAKLLYYFLRSNKSNINQSYNLLKTSGDFYSFFLE